MGGHWTDLFGLVCHSFSLKQAGQNLNLSPQDILEDIIIGTIWGLNIALISTRDFGFETAILIGFLVGIFIFATLFLIVDQELHPETTEVIKTILSVTGLGFLAFMLCIIILQTTIWNLSSPKQKCPKFNTWGIFVLPVLQVIND